MQCDDRTYSIYGTRVSQSGTILDISGIPISNPLLYQENPSVAFDGINYLVVWHDYDIAFDTDIYGARVSTMGVILDTIHIPISTDTNSQMNPSVAFDGTNYFVIWQEYQSSSSLDIYGTRVTTRGVVLDTTGIPITTAGNIQRNPAVISDGINNFVVWSDARNGVDYDIYGARVDTAGVVLEPLGIPISTEDSNQISPSTVFDGTHNLIVWTDSRSVVSHDIYGARVDTLGIVLDSSGFPISTETGDQGDPALSFDGINYMAVWSANDIYGVRITQSGIVIDSSSILISSTANNQRNSANAFDSTNYLVVWEDERTSNIYGNRVSQGGAILDSHVITISSVLCTQENPSIVYGEPYYLVVWQDYRCGGGYSDIYGCRVSPTTGVVLETLGIALSTAADVQEYPTLTFGNTDYFTVWSDWRSGSADIYGARVNQDGIVLDLSGIAISTAINWQLNPSVAFDGTNYFAVWQDLRSNIDIYAARITQNGNVLDASGIAVSTAANWQENPSVAFDGINYFVVWQDKRSGSSYDIYGARVNQSGIILDTSGIAVAVGADTQWAPSVVFDGTNYFIVWHEGWDGILNLYGARVSPSGVMIESFPVSVQIGDQISPALTHGPGDQILITWSGWTDSINGKPVNTMRIWGKFYPFTGIEETVQRFTSDTMHLFQNMPNPFESATTIFYQLPKDCAVSLKIYNVQGQLIKTLVNESKRPGTHTVSWDGKDEIGRKVANGVYFYHLTVENFNATKKLVILK